jgi:hypothetical protein
MNILLPVSRGPSFQDALSLAIEVAKAHAGDIRILYVIDRGEIERIGEGGGLAAIHLAQHAAEEVERRMMEEATMAILEATNVCARAGVPTGRSGKGNLRGSSWRRRGGATWRSGRSPPISNPTSRTSRGS